jgi:ribonuclease P protein component
VEHGFAFRRHEHLKEQDAIRKVFRQGKAFVCRGAKLFVLPNALTHNRIVFTFARKFGSAVERNRARRVGREAYRLMRRSLKTGFDLALLVYPGRDFLNERTEQCVTLFSRAALLSPAGRAALPGCAPSSPVVTRPGDGLRGAARRGL